MLALALERARCRQDFVGQMLRRVRLGRGETWLCRPIKRYRALPAELVFGRVTCSARRADRSKRRGALAAKSCSGGILDLALGTLHNASQGSGRVRAVSTVARAWSRRQFGDDVIRIWVMSSFQIETGANAPQTTPRK